MFGRQKSPGAESEAKPPLATPPETEFSPVTGDKVLKAIPFSPSWLPSPAATLLVESDTSRSVSIEKALAPDSLPVIVAEDDPVSRELVRRLLENWGYKVTVTSDGHEAMEAIRAQTSPALAVLDWMMPGMDGIKICQRVREANRVLYIILLTARGGKERLIEGLEAGADDYLMKPFDKDELRARLKVGARIIALHMALAARVVELETAASEIRSLRLQLPL